MFNLATSASLHVLSSTTRTSSWATQPDESNSTCPKKPNPNRPDPKVIHEKITRPDHVAGQVRTENFDLIISFDRTQPSTVLLKSYNPYTILAECEYTHAGLRQLFSTAQQNWMQPSNSSKCSPRLPFSLVIARDNGQ